MAACGQKGPLFFPTEPAAAQRATLPQALRLRPLPRDDAATRPAGQPAPREVPSEAPPTAPDLVPETTLPR